MNIPIEEFWLYLSNGCPVAFTNGNTSFLILWSKKPRQKRFWELWMIGWKPFVVFFLQAIKGFDSSWSSHCRSLIASWCFIVNTIRKTNIVKHNTIRNYDGSMFDTHRQIVLCFIYFHCLIVLSTDNLHI